ncbi:MULTISPECIES: hypothetical protein [unclassified Chitinophaga]|uniref:hypothetical protein n=1 Tax=unclassified Chitinophaga TaxID=2619133 RepID=UPI0009CE095C|nr:MULTISPECIES: hypothetical protein [unclassified Chitinophaga]OMP75869.1 hypothetical protein BW716_27895 [[Flexibacter] sp. ATCC 35208]WPV66156.1 hypothetical protein QQL36_30620 [Chitinophaga sp. LS1]
MKKLAAILLIFSLFIQTTANVWLVGLFYLKRDYIATNYCINRFDKIPVCKGSCFLEKQLEKEQEREKRNLELKQTPVTLWVHVIQTTGQTCPIAIIKNNFPDISIDLLTGIKYPILRPPIA